MLNYKLRQNIWSKIEKSNKIGKYKKSLISPFQCFLTEILDTITEILGTICRLLLIEGRGRRGGGGGARESEILIGKIFYQVIETCGDVILAI